MNTQTRKHLAATLIFALWASIGAHGAKHEHAMTIMPNAHASWAQELLPDEDAQVTFTPGPAPAGYVYAGMATQTTRSNPGFAWTGGYIINTLHENAVATVTATCTWIPAGEGGDGPGPELPVIIGTGTAMAFAQPATYWNTAEGHNVLAIGTSALMKAFKNQGTPANSTWSSSGELSMQPNGTTAEVTGIAASETAWDSNVHSVSVDYPALSDDELFTVVKVVSISAEPEAVCVGNSKIAYTMTTQPAGFEYMAQYTPADTSAPGVKEVVAVCGTSAATCTVTALKIDILDPEEDDVHLKGEEVKFDGELEPTGLSGVTYAWSVLEGICDPATATTEDFQTALKSDGTIKVKLAVTVGGTTCEKIRTITAVLPEVTKLSWKNDHNLLQGATGSSAITDPVWTKTLGGAVTKNDPGAYTKDTYATAELEIEGDSPLTHSTSVQVKGDGNTENFTAEGATFHNWTWSAGELQLDSSPLYASVNFYDTLNVTWYYRVQKLAGGWGDWVQMNESTHLLYTTLTTPTSPEATPHAVIIDYACRWAANETAEGGTCSSMLNNGFSAHYTWVYDCHRLSSDFIRLVAALGIGGSQHNWASKDSMSSGDVGWMCYQRTKSFTPVGGTAGVREWSWHQWAEASGSQRDPSAAASKSGSWGGYEDGLFTHYYECTNSTPFGAHWVANQSGQTSGCEVYPANCSYDSSPTVYSWRGPDR